MSPQLRDAENYYAAQDQYHADMLVKTLGYERAVEKCCEQHWVDILQQLQKPVEMAKAS